MYVCIIVLVLQYNTRCSVLKTCLQGYLLRSASQNVTAQGNLGGVSTEVGCLDWWHFPLPSQVVWGIAG